MIVVGTTLAPYVMKDPLSATSWLRTAAEMARITQKRTGHEVQFFAAIETDARGIAPFRDLFLALSEVDGRYWTFSIDDGSSHVSSDNRLMRICTGRNLIQRYALNNGASHALFLDADVSVPADSLARLLEVGYPFLGGHVPTYGLDGHKIGDLKFAGDEEVSWKVPEGHDIRMHWNTAGFLLVNDKIMSRVQWRYDLAAQMTDDPCYAADVQSWFGLPPLVDHSVVGSHYPDSIYPVETRYSETDREFIR